MPQLDPIAPLLGQESSEGLIDCWWHDERRIRLDSLGRVGGQWHTPEDVLRHPSAGLAARSAAGADAWAKVARAAERRRSSLVSLPVRGMGIESDNPLFACLAPNVDTAAVVVRWGELLNDAGRMLVDGGHADARMLGSMTTVVVPLVQRDGRILGRPQFEVESGSVSSAIGAVFLSPGAWDPLMMAEALVHESYHQLFNAALSVHRFVDNVDMMFPSPWKPDPRPAVAVLHGIVAFSAVRRFWQAEAAAGRGDRGEVGRRSAQIGTACRTLLAGGALTELGSRLVAAAVDASPAVAGGDRS